MSLLKRAGSTPTTLLIHSYYAQSTNRYIKSHVFEQIIV